jgi:hypothetical protein
VNCELSDQSHARISSPESPVLDGQASIQLRAGPFTLRFDAGDLRYIKLGEREVIRRIYAAVRDRNWGTVPSEISALKSEMAEDRFHFRYTSTHRQNEIHFVWNAEIVGDADGSIRFAFDGEAMTTFLRNRIGFCVLHPIRECAGAKCRAQHADGTQREVIFPQFVAAEQPVLGFHELVGLAHEIERDVWAEVKFAGELFEMEDQRNWMDASFKTYCTPLRLPYPVEIKAGTRVRQEIRVKIIDWRLKNEGCSQADTSNSSVFNRQSTIHNLQSESADSAVSIFVTNERRPLPTIGLGAASHGQPLTPNEIDHLAVLRLGHLRCDVKLEDCAWPELLWLAWQQAAALRVRLELGVHLPREQGESELVELGALLRALEAAVVRVLLFRDGEKTLSLASLRFARPHLAFLKVPIGAGTDADFYQLNQFRPPHAEADFIHWSMNPQVHAVDLASLAETPAAIPAQLQSGAAFFPGKPLVVSSITLRPRFNPVAMGPQPPVRAGELPPQVDPRQLSPFSAAWTLAALKYLAEAGAQSVTLFETTGWRGVMERTAGSSLPTKFPSEAGQVFPLFYAIGGINGPGAGKVVISRSSDPLRVESMAVTGNGPAWLWLANMTAQKQKVIIRGFPCEVCQHRIPWEAPDLWRFHPTTMLRSTGSELEKSADGDLEVPLEPYGLHWLESKEFE